MLADEYAADAGEPAHLDDAVAALGELLAELGQTLQTQRAQAARHAQQIEALHAVQSRLLQGKSWYRGILEAAPDAILISDHKGLIRLANPQAERLFGYQPGELLGQPLNAVLPSDGHDLQQTSQRRRGIRSDGCELILEASLARLPAQAGAPAQLCILLRAAGAERQARAQAEQEVRGNADLLANMSHEIRTPMNSILGMAHLALQTRLDAQQSECLQQIHNAGEHLMSLLDDILDYSRLDTGKLVWEPFSPQELLDSLGERFAARARGKGLQFSCAASAELPPRLLGDALRIGRILDKFVDNALKFTPQGSIEIGAGGQASGSNAFSLELFVRDTGIGLTGDQCSALFQGPYQADTSTTRRYAGTGLGLAIARKLTELMGGNLGVESRYGQGSTFWLKVTLGIASPLAESHPGDDQLHGRRVLLAEDNEVNQRLVCKLLERVGVEVEVAANGQEALERVRDGDYDLLLMDMQMPVLDGVAATRAIRQLGPRGQLPIIAISASALPEDRQRCLDAGMNDFLAKPLKVEALYAQLARWSGGRAPVAAQLPEPEQAAADEPPLPQVDGLDTAEGLRRTLGDRPLYLDLLRRLLDGERDTTADIHAALAGQDDDSALRMAHTLKGLLGTVGAGAAMARAADLEQALRDGATAEQLEARLRELEQRVTPLLDALAEQLAPATEATEPAASEELPLAEICRQLTAHLADDDAEALDCFNRHAASLRAAYPDDYPRLAGTVRDFEFAQALALLRQLQADQPSPTRELPVT